MSSFICLRQATTLRVRTLVPQMITELTISQRKAQTQNPAFRSSLRRRRYLFGLSLPIQSPYLQFIAIFTVIAQDASGALGVRTIYPPIAIAVPSSALAPIRCRG